MELVRREAEACDVLSGFVLLQSMAGGTGAGLGTYVAQVGGVWGEQHRPGMVGSRAADAEV